jgi:hypothetical protein
VAKHFTHQSKLESLTDEMIQQRWRSLRPKAIKGTLFFLTALLILFVGNHYCRLPQMAVNFVNVAFQICCVFTACGAFVILMSQLYGGPARRR